MNKGTAAAGGLSGALKGVGTSANLATGGIKAMTMALISSGVGALVVAVGMLIGGLGTVINKSRAFSKEMSGLKAVLGKDTDPLALKALKDDAKAFGASTAFTALQVVQLQTEFAKLGFTTDQILNATGATLDLAAAAGVDLAEAATVAGATLRGFGLKTSETQRVVDVMAKSFSSSSLDMSKFTESMKLVAPIAKTIKVPIEQATAALGVLADTGIHGSMAGTQLRRVMSDLAQKTGLSFRESLTMTSERLKNASSDAEKLAIAKELVGDRAKGSLIALAENTEQLDLLTAAFDKAGGAAKEMAEERLNNLDGDLTKLGSAWEGFILSLEDGDGVISQLARGSVQMLTDGIAYANQGLRKTSAAWIQMKGLFNAGAPIVKMLATQFLLLGARATKSFNQMKLDAADVPLIGGLVDKEKARAAIRQASAQLQKGEALVRRYAAESRKIMEDAKLESMRVLLGINESGRTQEQEAEFRAEEEFRAGQAKKDEEAGKKAAADRKAFLLKLKKLEEDTDDQTALEKIERKRLRHLAELKTIKMNATERKQAELDINNIYDEQEAIQKAKNRKKFEAMFGQKGLDPLEKIEADRAKHLLELDALEISETEKEELKLRIKNHYDGLRDTAQLTIDAKQDKIDKDKADREEAARQARIAGMYRVLDSAADIAGKETAMGKALMALKLAMQLKELAMKMGIIKSELAVKASAAMGEAGIEGAKVGTAIAGGMAETSKIGFPWNVITMAGYALQAASLIKAFAGSKKKLSNIATANGGSGGGAGASAPPAPPSFNVIGGTSAGDELIASTVAGVNNAPMRAYVVESDVSSSQELQRNTETIASIG
tara:strand:- start:12525 stop:15035 length:2511 start_codon:yes stop_codon:yes gene_type:complete